MRPRCTGQQEPSPTCIQSKASEVLKQPSRPLSLTTPPPPNALQARSWINGVVCGFLEYDEEGAVKQETIKPMVDGGTEGFKGHARVILPGVTPCFQCTLWLFPPQVRFCPYR